jgi:putative membrane protein
MGWYGMGPGWVGWMMMTATTMATLALLALAAFVLYRGSRRDTGPATRPVVDPESVLDERFARGEIDVDEYTKRRDALREAH